MFSSEIGGVIAKTSITKVAVTLGKTINNFNQSIPDQERTPTPTRVWFGVPIGIATFCGRQKFLNKLHKTLQQNNGDQKTSQSVTILSQLKVVSGLGGIGKTQTALKYIYTFGHLYEHVIWIEAETETTLKNSFLKLAGELKVPTHNFEGGRPEKIDKIVHGVYKKLCGGTKSTLFVFDNADDFKSGVEAFLPSTVDPEQENLRILVTSRNQDWSRRFEKFQVLPLDLLTDAETLSFILTQMDIADPDSPETREETREYIQLVGGLPLALQQSVAYIKERKSFVGQHYKFSDYITEFKSTMLNILDYDKIPGSSSTVLVTWNVTFEKIKTLDKGKLAIELIQVLSLLYADKIPVTFIQSLFPKFKELKIVRCLTLLEKYSLVKREVQETLDFVTIHRQLQFVIIQNLKNLSKNIFGKGLKKNPAVLFKTTHFAQNLESVFNYVIKKCRFVLKTINLAKSADIVINVHQLVENAFKFIPIREKFINFLEDFAVVLHNAGRYSESVDLCKNIQKNRRELFGENHGKTLDIQRILAENLTELGKYNEVLSLCRDVLEKMKIHLGPQHETTLATKHEVARILYQSNYPESWILTQEVFEQKKKVLGPNHESTLRTQQLLAQVYAEQREFGTALEMLKEVEEKLVEILGADHPNTLNALHNKAVVLLRIRRFQEASDLFCDVYEKRREILGENHPRTVKTREWIVFLAVKQGKIEEALKMKRQALEQRKTFVGNNHAETKLNEENINFLIEKMSETSTNE